MRFSVPSIFLIGCALGTQAARAQEYADYHGAWQGQVLLQMSHESGVPQGAATVHAGTLAIAVDGAVRGQVVGAGCTLSGAASDFVSAANASIDVMITACKDPKFNGRFTGRLLINPTLKYASLRLGFTRSLDSGTAQLSAILRR